MNLNQRFRAVLEGSGDTDAYPVIEWATWWDKTIRFWEGEGLPAGLEKEAVYDYFGLDRNLQFWLPHRGPGLPEKEHGAPRIRSLGEYRELKRHLYPDTAVRDIAGQLRDAARQQQEGKALVWYTLEGFFWFPRDLFGIEDHLVSFYDEPELYHLICEDLLEWQLRMVDELAEYVKADFMTIAEDMSYNLGPMISGEMFREFIAPYYKRLIPRIKEYGTKVIVDSDGDITAAVPWFIEAGVEGILPLERQAGVDISLLQKQFPEFCWIGGYDKMCMFEGKEAIDEEFRRLLPAIRAGRFIPSVDHQTPPGVTMENYRHYVAHLREYARHSCTACGVPG